MRPQYLTLSYLTRYLNFITKINSNFSSTSFSSARILNYHSINKDNNINDIYSVTSKNFYDHMLSIHKRFREKVKVLNLENIKKPFLFITFDDGYDNNLTTALPIMEEFQFPFTLYVTTDFLKKNHRQYLTVKKLKKISSSPLVSIGSHSKTHPYLTKCDYLQLKSEISDSKKYLEDLTGKSVDSFAYPFGDVNNLVANFVKESGYNFAVTTYPGAVNKNSEHFYLKRNVILSHDDEIIVQDKIDGYWDWIGKFIENPFKK